MRYCLFLFAFLLSCQDTKSEMKNTVSKSVTKAIETKTIESNKKTEPPFLLTDKNVMEFFLEYDKNTKKTKSESQPILERSISNFLKRRNFIVQTLFI